RDFSGELRITRRNGETLWVKVTGRGEFRGDRCLRVYGSFQNINTQKLTELELIRARDAAEQAAVSKSEFLATMSHEIRTPMNGIMGMLSLLGNSELNYEQSKRVHIAKTSAQTLLSLIDDILDFSRIDAGKLETESIRFPLHQLFEDVAESMSLRAQEKGLELVLDLSEVEPEYVIGDPARIRQILNNLTGNAIKFTEYGEVVIRAAVRETSNGLALSCAVHDTGIGIPLNKQGLLFCAFTQVDASTTRKYGGSGLGLSICHKLCTLMGGEIKLSSNAGDGSTFSFYLPLKAASSDQRHSRIATDRTILVVDDNQSSREAIARQYSHWGATVHTAASAEAALALLEQRDACLARCDLCIIDRNLPGLDGTELVQFLRQAPQLSEVPMVLMCNINSHGTNDHFQELGFDAWYPKPVTRSAMADFL
ncbi:MAG: ATP-binding protein, partial [Spongiibacter sp.]